MLRLLAQPRVFIPILLSIALLAFVFSVADAPTVLGDIGRIPIPTVLFILGLAAAYLAIKGIQWHLFMDGLDIPIPWRQLVLAFAVGEMTLPIPAGVYAQNYVLRRIASADFSKSSAATTAVLATEAGVSLLGLLVVGVPGWDWLRPAILAFVGVAGFVILVLRGVRPLNNAVRRLLRSGPLESVGPEFLELVDGLGTLFSPRVAARAAPLAIVYLFALVLAFFLTGHGVGITSFDLRQGASIYLFALTIVLVLPVSSHLGVTEASGLGAMDAWGYSSTQALAALLGFRLVWTGAIWFLCIPALIFLRAEWASMRQEFDEADSRRARRESRRDTRHENR